MTDAQGYQPDKRAENVSVTLLACMFWIFVLAGVVVLVIAFNPSDTVTTGYLTRDVASTNIPLLICGVAAIIIGFMAGVVCLAVFAWLHERRSTAVPA